MAFFEGQRKVGDGNPLEEVGSWGGMCAFHGFSYEWLASTLPPTLPFLVAMS